ncbi:MAG: DNA-processing protein DprA [Clostridia bacterium]|nr:DNA-processing protein DprA [Clostridia bacterium]
MNYWLWFASIEMLGSVKKQKLLEKYQSPENIYYLEKEKIMQISGIGEKIWNNINLSKDISKINKIQDFMNKHHIHQLNIDDEEYPKGLKNIYDPPITLFYVGNIELLKNKCIAVVGSRAATEYGKNVAFHIANELSQNDYTVVSGLAAGIDGAAHRGAVHNSNSTIAVIGSGLDYTYPIENYSLYGEIARKGLILTEYIVGTKPLSCNFPARNRIISGISEGVIVVEASKKSGSLITVDFALEQGKNVYAVPGNINSFNSIGTNELMKDGAIPYTGISDLLL